MARNREIVFLATSLAVVGLCASVVAGDLVSSETVTVEAPQGYVSAAVLDVVGTVPSTGAVADAFQDLVEASAYHAAFAVAPSGDYGWADNYATQADADLAALAWCRGEVGVQGCEIVARIRPAEEIFVEGQPLSKTAAEGADTYGGYGSYKAFALSNLGDWGMAWNHPTKAAAVADALATCRSYLTNDVPGAPFTGECRVIWSD